MPDFPLTAIDGKNMRAAFRELNRPFLDEEVEWRVERTRKGNNGRPAVATLAAYADQRIILDRLDKVLGSWNWQSATRRFPGGCDVGIGILVRKEWVWKWDGAGQREMPASQKHHEPKAAASDGLKRVAMLWGMGRHLWRLPQTKVNVIPGKPWEKPQGVPDHRLVRVNDRKSGVDGWAIAPSIREMQAHLLTIEDLIVDIDDPVQRRFARIDAVRAKMNWRPPNQVPAGEGVKILMAFEAASAIWEDGKPTQRGTQKPSTASHDQLKVASHRLVDWFEDGVLQDRMTEYGEWVLGLSDADDSTPESQNPGPSQPHGLDGGDPWGSRPSTGSDGGDQGGPPQVNPAEIPY